MLLIYFAALCNAIPFLGMNVGTTLSSQLKDACVLEQAGGPQEKATFTCRVVTDSQVTTPPYQEVRCNEH